MAPTDTKSSLPATGFVFCAIYLLTAFITAGAVACLLAAFFFIYLTPSANFFLNLVILAFVSPDLYLPVAVATWSYLPIYLRTSATLGEIGSPLFESKLDNSS